MRTTTAFLVWMLLAAIAVAEGPVVPIDSLEGFEAAARPHLQEPLRGDAKLWRQIAPSVRWLLHDHRERFLALPPERQKDIINEAAQLVINARKRHAREPVIGPDRPIVALLDPDKGLEPKQITALAGAYGTEARVLKREGAASIETVAGEFLSAVEGLAATGRPATVVVVGHGLPKEIQSYHVPVDRLAAALVAGAAGGSAADASTGASIDLSRMVLVFDDCFSADFCMNLARSIRREAVGRGARLVSLPILVAGANRDSYGIVDIGEKFVTHFWDTVIELYFVRAPHPAAVTLGNFFGNVDNAMYGYGRVPVFEGTRIVGYKLVEPRLVQDPVCFVPLCDEELASLRRLLDLDEADDLLPLLDAG